MQINIIAAVARNGAIGHQNKLIYWLPNDLKRFKALTTGHTIIMGRNTFLSLPKGALPNRRNVVLSSTQSVTEIDDTPDVADAFFPNYDGWKETARECHEKDEKHAFNYCFADYERPTAPSRG